MTEKSELCGCAALRGCDTLTLATAGEEHLTDCIEESVRLSHF